MQPFGPESAKRLIGSCGKTVAFRDFYLNFDTQRNFISYQLSKFRPNRPVNSEVIAFDSLSNLNFAAFFSKERELNSHS